MLLAIANREARCGLRIRTRRGASPRFGVATILVRSLFIHFMPGGRQPCCLYDRKSPSCCFKFTAGRHPELFEVYATRTVRRGDYEATINITSAGHVVAWRYQGITLTEVAASAQHPLPQRRRLMSYLLKGERQDRVECRGGVRYQMNFQLEGVEPQVFWTFQQELALDGKHQGMLHRFDSSGRMAPGT